MSKWTKEELENMLEDVVNALDLSDTAIETHGPRGTAPAELVRLVLEQKDRQIKMLQSGMVQIGDPSAAPLTWTREKPKRAPGPCGPAVTPKSANTIVATIFHKPIFVLT